jgi:hypothetical protein
LQTRVQAPIPTNRRQSAAAVAVLVPGGGRERMGHERATNPSASAGNDRKALAGASND